MRLSHYLTAAICVLLAGCHTAPPIPTANPGTSSLARRTRDNAYSLLFDLLNQQKDVSKLLIVKRDSRELHALIKKISTLSADAVAQLKKFQATDQSLNFELIHLPPGETATRKAIAATKTKELLGASGDAFELALLLTQIEALSYAAHLAQVAAANDADPNRANWLKSLSEDMKVCQASCVELVSRKPHPR